jgi:type II secretory pathway pseudopilin PulG
MKKYTAKPAVAFSLVEIMIGLAILFLVGGLAYSVLINATTLMAKNLSLNASSTTLRAALDRVYSEINQANGLPKLINADASTAASASGPTAGIVFDRYQGGPYVVTNPGTSGLVSTATSFEMKSSTDPLASPPVPQKNDVVSMDGGNTRPLVQSCVVSTSGGLQTLTVQLQGAIGKAIPWTTDVQKIAYLIHREAFVIVPGGGRAELRFYGSAETLGPGNYNDTTTYVVLTRDIGTANGETTPFTLVTQSGTTFLNIAMRVEDRQFNAYLATRQANEFNTFLRVDTMLRPRNFL